MPRKHSFLTPRAKEALILYVALNGENRERYEEYCNRTGIRQFTPYYFRTWINRNRTAIQHQRLSHMAEIRQLSALDRGKRMAMLEDNARICGERIASLLEHPEHVDLRLLTTLMEQQRKLLEAIARERGEWGVADDGPSDLSRIHDQILKEMEKAARPLLGEAVVAGEFREITEGAEVVP